MESYSRAYPLLFRLHLLSDISHHKMIEMEVNEPGRVSVLDRWNYRAVATAPSISERSTLSGAHRTILSLYGKNERIAANWLSFSKFMRSLGKFDMAKLALRNAESVGLDADVSLMEEAYILKASGEIQKALNLIEPTEIDPIMILRSLRPETLSSYLDTEEKRHRLAAKIQFATELMILSRQKHGRSILDRYKCITALNRHWEKAYYDFGRYYETLYTEMKNNEDAVSDTNRVFSGTSRSGRSQSVAEERVNVSYEYLKKAVERYGLCLKIGSKMTTQALTRMLTLWLTFCSLEEGIDSSQLSSSRATESALSIAQKDCNVILGHSSGQVSSSVWFKCTTQLVSRVGHRNKNTLAIIVNILTKVIANYPAQGIWQIAGLLGSFNKDRRGIGFKILMDAHGAMQKEKPREAKMLEESNELFKNLVDLAKFDAKDKKMKWRTPADLTLSSFLVPTQRALTNCDKLEGLKDEDRMRYVGAERMFIGRFDQIVDVASSKAKPKTLAIHTMCGKKVKFLCKQEKDGDLRKDARMMEFNSVVNGLLAEDQEGRKRNLRLRTYSVLCLNEECGILEWVNNTECLRALIGKAHSYWPELYPPTNYKALYDNFLNAQKINDTNLNGTVENYIHNVLPHCHPCFHKWFIEKFVDPTEWYEARNTFTRSAAVWSAVGHVIGLGDRHTENILIDVTIGECVHVDFDCLFDKGLSLNRPEIVPFRLTPSMVDGMGPMGVEGSYRRAMEVTMTVLRSNSDNLLAVLEPFLRDPTVSWQRNGRTQQRNEARSGKSTTSGFVDYENKEAAEMLKKISQRLEGVYNLVHPHRIGYLRGCESRGEAKPVRGLGASKEDSLPLSVPGQVQRLIEEATAIENLCQMFVGKWLVTLLCLLVKAYEGRELFRVAAMDVVGEHLTSYEQ